MRLTLVLPRCSRYNGPVGVESRSDCAVSDGEEETVRDAHLQDCGELVIYSAEQIDHITRGKNKVQVGLSRLQRRLIYEHAPKLKSDRAREYLLQGICRRLSILRRSIDNVFTIFPPCRENLLSDGESGDLEINLHAFAINAYGVLDNIAWVFVYENSLERQIQGGRRGVGLFADKTMKHFPERIREYLNGETLRSWYRDYAKNYRDALAHRIPLYVPPSTLGPKDAERYYEYDTAISKRLAIDDLDNIKQLRDEQASIGSICGAFLHSYSDSDAPLPVMFHAQMLADSNTVMEMISVVILEEQT